MVRNLLALISVQNTKHSVREISVFVHYDFMLSCHDLVMTYIIKPKSVAELPMSLSHEEQHPIQSSTFIAWEEGTMR